MYIEALWGIPEGLYYYPCDAYWINTRTPSASDLEPKTTDRFLIQREVRFKGQFVAPDADGTFRLCTTQQPWDWKGVINDDSVVRQMTLFTRQLAGVEGRAVKIMWFLGCAPWTGLPHALPWYHDFEADGWTTAGSHQRNSRDEVVALRTLDDLKALERKAADAYKPMDARRLLVLLDPAEDQIIRSEAVAERVGKAAHSLGAIVELQGGVLSHVYYALRRTGVDVSVKNRPHFRPRHTTFHKLVRDRIPGVVAAGGERAKIRRLSPEELRAALKIKLVEEAFEARDATADELVQELADVLEVVDALIEASHISPSEQQKVQNAKRLSRGGFKEGIMLLETKLDQWESETASTTPSVLPGATRGAGVVETAQSVRLEGVRSGPSEVREGEEFVEFVHTFDVGLTHAEWSLASPETLGIDTPLPADSIGWIVEGKRDGAQLKLRLKIRVGTRQMRLRFGGEGRGGKQD